MNRYILIRRLTGPSILLLLGIIALLHEADLVSWNLFFPLLLILIGVLKLAQRAALAAASDEPPYPGGYPGAYPGAYPGGTIRALPILIPAGSIRARVLRKARGNRAARLCRLRRRTSDGVRREDSHEHASVHTTGRHTAAVRSPHAVAGLPGAAKGCVARTARRVESAAARVESWLRGCVWPARSFDRRPHHSGGHRHRGRPALQRPHCAQRILGLVWPLVAAAADRRRAGHAGRVGVGPAPDHAGAPRRRVCGHPDSAGHSWASRRPGGTASGARCARSGATTTTISSTSSACPSTISTSRC